MSTDWRLQYVCHLWYTQHIAIGLPVVYMVVCYTFRMFYLMFLMFLSSSLASFIIISGICAGVVF